MYNNNIMYKNVQFSPRVFPSETKRKLVLLQGQLFRLISRRVCAWRVCAAAYNNDDDDDNNNNNNALLRRSRHFLDIFIRN